MREASGAVFNTDPIMAVDPHLLETIKQRACAAPRGRYRLCLHQSTSEPVQQMIIAHTRASYTRPHRQDASKLYVMIQGELLILVFDDQGHVQQRIALKSGGLDGPFSLRLAPGFWHTTFAWSEVAVVCEVMGSPNPDGQASEYADWAPAEGDTEAVEAYRKKLRVEG